MPRLLDWDERRPIVMRALFELVDAGGPDQVTLRAVAAGAGLSVGSLRHCWAHRDLLLDDACAHAAGQVVRRYRLLCFGRRYTLSDIGRTALPVDEDHRLAYVGLRRLPSYAALTPPVLAAVADADEWLAALCREALESATGGTVDVDDVRVTIAVAAVTGLVDAAVDRRLEVQAAQRAIEHLSSLLLGPCPDLREAPS